jgi:multiple sugar transport system substrate-binding protein
MSSRATFRTIALALVLAMGIAACPAEDDPPDVADPPDDEVVDDIGEVVFFSTQLAPIEEAETVRRVILADFPGDAEFIGADSYAAWADRVSAEIEADRGTVDLLGGLHGDFSSLGVDGLVPLTDLMNELADRGFAESFVELSRLGTDDSYYIPWMQATYIMAAHVDALDHLPDGADLDSLTYDELYEWAANMHDATGSPQFGMPAGEGGLLHRFMQGYLIPSFSGGLLTTYSSSGAEQGWEWFVDIWEHTHPQSAFYDFMQEPLLGGEVLVAWDHVARLIEAFDQRPDEFVAFPAPVGPEGLAFMPVLAGLGIPTTAPNPDGARELIRYLTEADIQALTLQEVGFFPVIEDDVEADLPEGIGIQAEAVGTQAGHPDALPSLLPVGLGEREGEFTRAFWATFESIVLRGQDISTVLAQQASVLGEIMEDTGAVCWEPDPPSAPDPCPVQ